MSHDIDLMPAAPAPPERGRRLLPALALMAASGCAALGYQIAWTQQAALWLGHEAMAVLAVVAAFFAGLGIGALALGPAIERSPWPLRWYVAFEAAIGLWGLVLWWAMEPLAGQMLTITGAQPSAGWQWAVAFCGTFVTLLPATAAMGATLPAMERITTDLRVRGRSIGALYAGNTLGAVVGVLAAAFWLVPTFGLATTVLVCVALNLSCALGAGLVFPARVASVGARPAPSAAASVPGALAGLAITGLLGIGYEVLAVRVLSQVAENTVYTFALLLSVYLAGTTLGAAAYERWRSRLVDAAMARDGLLAALALACLCGGASLWAAEAARELLRSLLGQGMFAALAAEALLALFAFGPPTLVMGALFSHLTGRANAIGISFGRAMGANTLGAAAAPWLFGVWALPTLGPKWALVLLALGYLALIPARRWRTWPAAAAWVTAAGALLLGLLAPRLAFIEVPEGGTIVSYLEGAVASVSVVEDADGVRRLRIDNRQQEGSNATRLVDGRQGLLPILLHPQPRDALFLGLGTGVTSSTAALDPTLRVEAVELLPEVVASAAYFAPPDAGSVPRPVVRVADARRYVRAVDKRYEVIVADNFHPARSGSALLYTVEHFRAVRERLADDGVFCQWLPLHQLDLDTLRSIARSFVAVYPEATALLASNSLETPVLGLVGRRDGRRFDAARLDSRREVLSAAVDLASFGLEDGLALFGSFVAGPRALQRFAASAEPNTDDRPLVAYRAPRITYAPDSLPRDRLMTLLQALEATPAEWIDRSADGWIDRLENYVRARNLFLATGRSVHPTADVRDMLAQVREPLLTALRTSPDFRPAYDPLLRMAVALARSDAAAARALLLELSRIQPDRDDAQRALLAIGGAAQ